MTKNVKLSLLIFFISFIPYLNGINNAFLWDDEFLIEKNSFITSFQYIPDILSKSSTAGFGGQDNFYRPTQTLYYLIIHSIAGKSEVAFHLGNMLLHSLNALLLFFLILKIFNNLRLAFLTSLLWSLHPTHTEAVTYMSGTADPLSFLFLMLSLLSFPLEKKPKYWIYFASSLALFSLALISKESVIIAPGLFFAMIFYKNKHLWNWKSYLPVLPSLSLSIIYLILRETILNFDGTYEFYKVSNIYTENIHYRAFTFFAAFTEYLKILFFPYHLHMERAFPVFIHFFTPKVLLGFSLILLSPIVILFLKSKKQLGFAWLWFFIAFVPMMGIFIPVNSFILEHWLYLPSVGFFLCIASFLLWLNDKVPGKSIPAFTTALLLLFSFLTYTRNKDWKDPIQFYSNILQYNEGTARIHNNIAMAYSDQNLFQKAIEHYNIAISMSDTYPQTHYNLARVYIQTQQISLARKHLMRSLEINPQFTHSQKLLQDIQRYMGSAE